VGTTNYKGKLLGGKLKLDLLVNDLIIIENKAVEIMIPLYEAHTSLIFEISKQT
jgi:hypothetical protein